MESEPASDLSSYDATALAKLIQAKQITASEVVEDAIRKIEAINPALNAVVHKTFDEARRRALQPLGNGPFAGVPILLKDNATVAGMLLTRGCRALRGHRPDTTAPFFAAIERAGFITLGVTNMPELGLIDGSENVLFGPTRNPWHLDYSPGGSSGGSAACVAAGIVPLAHGTDGGGSLRIPASHCGLFGFKCSRHRLLAGRTSELCWDFLVDGPLVRTVRDAALLISVTENPTTPLATIGFVPRRPGRRLKIALMYRGMGGQVPHPEVANAIADTAELCRQRGHIVEEAAPDLEWMELDRASRQIGAVEAAKAVDAIAAVQGLVRLEDGFESRALGLREEALRKGSFDDQIAGLSWS